MGSQKLDCKPENGGGGKGKGSARKASGKNWTWGRDVLKYRFILGIYQYEPLSRRWVNILMKGDRQMTSEMELIQEESWTRGN